MEKGTQTAPAAPQSDPPLAGYQGLTVARVLPRIDGLTPQQLLRLREYERAHGNRQPVLEAITRALAA